MWDYSDPRAKSTLLYSQVCSHTAESANEISTFKDLYHEEYSEVVGIAQSNKWQLN